MWADIKPHSIVAPEPRGGTSNLISRQHRHCYHQMTGSVLPHIIETFRSCIASTALFQSFKVEQKILGVKRNVLFSVLACINKQIQYHDTFLKEKWVYPQYGECSILCKDALF